jgi:redox-sensitive bicupin YhaK (pirin superfamily)
MDGFQLWVNLPASQKMSRPRYRGLTAGDIPVAQGKGWHARVVAGEIAGTHGPVTEITADPIYMEIELEQGAEFNLSVPESHTTLAYVFQGQALFGDREVSAVNLAIFGKGKQVWVSAKNSTVRFMLISGAPFGEPIVPYGPFVMNTRAEIQQALNDLRNGTFVYNEPPV